MLTIVPRGNRVVLQGDIPTSLEAELRQRFSWTNPLDLNDQTLFYADRVAYSGIVYELQEYIEKRGVQCDLLFGERLPREKDWQLTRPYRPLQERLVDAAIECRYGIIRAPCGVGKTTVAAGIICSLGLPGSWIIVPNERPFVQALDTLRRHTTIGRVGALAGTGEKALEDVTVATIQSLNVQLKNSPDGEFAKAWRNAKVVICDEVHKAGADGYTTVLNQLTNVEYLLGVSATPTRTDDRAEFLEAILGKIVGEISRAEAIDNRLSVPLTVFVEDQEPADYGFIKDRASWQNRRPKKGVKPPYDESYYRYVVTNEARNLAAIEFCKQSAAEGLSVVISVKLIEHIAELRRLCPELVELHGKTPNRQEIFDSLQSKRSMMVVSTLMDEAVDVASLSCVAMLAGGKSSIKLQQRIRCDRIFEGVTVSGWFAKDRGYVWFPRDTADFLTSHSDANIKLLRSITDAHPEHQFYMNGVLLPKGKPIPRRNRERITKYAA